MHYTLIRNVIKWTYINCI